jgi:hypothetical protein
MAEQFRRSDADRGIIGSTITEPIFYERKQVSEGSETLLSVGPVSANFEGLSNNDKTMHTAC